MHQYLQVTDMFHIQYQYGNAYIIVTTSNKYITGEQITTPKVRRYMQLWH